MTHIILLDGGMGQELVHRAGDKPTALWSTQVMMESPGLVSEVHNDYFDAGSTIATANSYAIHRDRLIAAGAELDFEGLLATALGEAKNAKRNGTRIAGSIGPLIASYRPDLHPEPEEAIPLYTEVANLMAAEVDLIICETIGSISHATSALTGAMTAGKPVWVSFTVDDEDGTKLRSGEALVDAIAACQDADAILANCSSPESLDMAMPILAQSGKPFGGYGNAFTDTTKSFLEAKPTEAKPTADSAPERREMAPDLYSAHVMNWVAQGATIVGGCCETGPAHIQAVARALRADGHRIV